MDCYIGARIRLARERRTTSAEDLAQAVGATASLIASFEAGREKIRPAMLHRIAMTLGVTLGSLFGVEAA